MKLIATTEDVFAASRSQVMIKQALQGNDQTGSTIETWAYTRSKDNYDIIYHDAKQYVGDPEKNVIFRMELDGCNLVFQTAHWVNKPTPTREMDSLHTGRLLEMLLSHFSRYISQVSVSNFNY